MISLVPFIIYKDNKVLIYSGIDNNSHPIYCHIDKTQYITAKKLEYAFKELVQDDIDIVNNNELKLELKNTTEYIIIFPNRHMKKIVGRKIP